MLRRLFAGVVLIALAGCGGGGSSAPAPVPAPTATPSGSSTQGTLYVAGNDHLTSFPITANGAVAPTAATGTLAGPGSGSGNWTRVAAVGIGTEGSVLLSIQTQVAGYPGVPTQWNCSFNTLTANLVFTGTTASQPPCAGGFDAAVVLGRSNGDFDYLARSFAGQSEVIRLHSDGSTVVRLTAGAGQYFEAFAEDATGNVYVATGSTVLEYSGASDVASTTPSRTIPTASGPAALAVAPDGTIYAGLNGPSQIVAIPVTGSARTFGSYASTASIRGLATDSAGDVYVGVTGSNNGLQTEVDTYAPNSSTPMRVLANPVPSEVPAPQLLGIAVSQ